MKPLLTPSFLLLLAAAFTPPVGAGEFKAGAAQVVITPPVGTPIGGGYALRPSNGKLDDLYAKAIVVEQDGAKAAFVALDVCYTIRPVITGARKLIAEQCGIPPERVMISATHTHSGPTQTRCNLMDVITGADKPISQEYTAKLPSLIARVVVDKIGKTKQNIPVMANAVCIMESAEKKDVPLEAEVQAIAFSDDLAIVALPGEIFVELGLALKKASPFKHTFIAELANGSIGYVPNQSAYPEGNYEVVSARCASGGGEKLVHAAVNMLNELHANN